LEKALFANASYTYLSLLAIILKPFHFVTVFEACSTDAFICMDPLPNIIFNHQWKNRF